MSLHDDDQPTRHSAAPALAEDSPPLPSHKVAQPANGLRWSFFSNARCHGLAIPRASPHHHLFHGEMVDGP